MSAPLRVLEIANQAGLLRLFVLPACRKMQQAGAEVELACMAAGPNYEPLAASSFSVHGLSGGSWLNPLTWVRAYRQVRRLLGRGRYDLMVVHSPAMSWIARRAARGCVPAVVYTAHGLPFAPGQCPVWYALLRRIERHAGCFTDGIIVMNEVDARACQRYHLPHEGGQWFQVPGVGVDVDAWSAPPPAERLHRLDEELNLSSQRPVVLYLGRFIAAKRPGVVLELARRHGEADFILAGEGRLWGRIHRRGRVLPNVRVLGWRDDIHTLVHRCDVAVFPSVFREGLPRFLLEAQAAGKPVIAYDVRGSRDAVDDGGTGLLVRPGDVAALDAALSRVLGDAEAARRMGQAGRRRMAERFSLGQATAAHLSALAAVLARKGLSAPWAEATAQ
jgi:glycosyltransferase involved in cell wall biosynthesis